jgi:hypothetical protein
MEELVSLVVKKVFHVIARRAVKRPDDTSAARQCR